MKYKLFEEIALNKDVPGKNLKKGDITTIVEYHPVKVERKMGQALMPPFFTGDRV